METGVIRVVGRIEVEPQGCRGAQMGLAQIAVDKSDGLFGFLSQTEDVSAKGAFTAIRPPQN